MQVRVMEEGGYRSALYGLSLSHHAPLEKMPERLQKLAFKQGGHNKALEHIVAWVDVQGTLKWWKQADTYRLSSKQSESTMHCILDRPLVQEDFARPLPSGWLETLNDLVVGKNFDDVTDLLPSCYLQRREWMMSYKTIQNIVAQRSNHKLGEWREFIGQLVAQLQHPELVWP